MLFPEVVAKQLELRRPATAAKISELMLAFGPVLEDYADFLKESNGCVGTGPHLFVTLSPVEEILNFKDLYMREQSGIRGVDIGGDGCGNYIGIDLLAHQNGRVAFVWFDPIALDQVEWERADRRAGTLSDLLLLINDYYEGLNSEA